MNDVSVIIPAYNAEKFIGEAIESALAQTRRPLEVIVVDDASTDNTAEAAGSFGSAVAVLHMKQNSGVGKTRNYGVSHAHGDYIAYLDADDCWKTDHLEKLSGLMDLYPDVGLVFSMKRYFGEAEGIWPPGDLSKFANPGFFFFEFLRNVPCVPSTTMVRRSIHDKIGGFDNGRYRTRDGRPIQSEDSDYATRIALIAQIVCNPTVTVMYRRHADQATRVRDEQLLQNFRYRLAILRLLKNDHYEQEFIRKAEDRVLRGWENHIDRMWARRNMRGLRKSVLFGVKSRLLAPVSLCYAHKACVGGFIKK